MQNDILEKFTAHLKSVLSRSYSLAVEMGSQGINPEHLLLALLLQKGSIGGEILRKTNASAEEIRRIMHLASGGREGGRVHRDVPKLSTDAKRTIEKAVLTANQHEHKYVGTEHLLSGLLQVDSPAVDAILADQSVNMAELREQVDVVLKSTSKFPEITETFEVGKAPKQRDEAQAKAEQKKASRAAKPKTPALDFFAVDLTNLKLQENIDPVIGRDKEIERLIQILCRRTKNNPVLLGEAGVGKTAIVEGLAKKIIRGEVPEVLHGRRILALDLGLMLAGTIYRGEFEGRVKQIIDEVKNNADIILFIDELHTIMGAGATSGSIDAANILKPALARGDMHCIGATTLAEFKKHIEGDGALERRFQSIIVDPPSPEATTAILKGLRENYETYHGVTITDEAIEAAVALSERYLTDRFLPDKAIDLIDEAAACVRVAKSGEGDARRAKTAEEELDKVGRKKQKAVMTENFIEALELKAKEEQLKSEIAALKRPATAKQKPRVGAIGRREVSAVIARATGIPLTELLTEEKDRLLTLEDRIRARIVGQDEAATAVAELVRRAKAGIAHPDRPLASFLFLGPSGVGKTELAKVLAETVFQDRDAIVRIDMSEFAEGFNVSKLIGAPAGYVGYKDGAKLTDAVKRKPHALVLFDEIEKAHSEVHNLLLQMLEDGHLTDATGRKINFKNSIIVMTSNVGAQHFTKQSIGFGDAHDGKTSAADAADQRAGVLKDLETQFRPEFINRIDKVVVFNPLSTDDLKSVVKLQLADLATRVARDYGVALAFRPAVIDLLAEKSWNPLYGARGVRRQIQDLVENPLARALLSDAYRNGDAVTLSTKNDLLTMTKRSHARTPAA